MNFPDNQLTGVLAEVDVEQLFLSWRWNVGHDRIDIGYDLCVTPDRIKYRGARFLVQVKGTAQKKNRGNIVAPVAKARLRQYAEDMMPVFIVRGTPDGRLYWVHAQQWTRANRGRLSGDGTSGVRFDAGCTLGDRAAFETYLQEVLSRTVDDAQIAEETRFLNSLDPRLGVRLSVRDGAREHQVFAKSEAVESTLTFAPAPTQENLNSLRDAIDFGLPRSVEVENFELAGSPLFAHIGANVQRKGTLTMGEGSKAVGRVRLFPGHKYSITAAEFALDAELFKGQKGAAITNERKDSLFDLGIRLSSQKPRGQLTLNIGIRSAAIAGRPIQQFDALRSVGTWAEQVALQQSIFMELDFLGSCAPASASSLDSLGQFLHFARTLSRLHLVAKSMNSAFTLPAEFEMSAENVADIDLAYVLLKGERHAMKLGPIEFEPAQPLKDASGDKLYCTTTLSLAVLDQSLGDIPVAVEFSGYVLDALPGTSNVRLSDGGAGQAWISYAEHGGEGVYVRSAQGK